MLLHSKRNYYKETYLFFVCSYLLVSLCCFLNIFWGDKRKFYQVLNDLGELPVNTIIIKNILIDTPEPIQIVPGNVNTFTI